MEQLNCLKQSSPTTGIAKIFNVHGEFRADLQEHNRNGQTFYLKQLPTVTILRRNLDRNNFGSLYFAQEISYIGEEAQISVDLTQAGMLKCVNATSVL